MKQRRRTEYGVGRVHGHLILSRIANEALSISEGHITGSGSVPLIVSDDLDTIVLPHTNTTVRGSEIDPDRRSFSSHDCKLLLFGKNK
jgi:hypothetical protein